MSNAAAAAPESIDLLALLAEVEADNAWLRANGIVNILDVRSSARRCRERLEARRRHPDTRCGRCGGTGHLQEFYYVAGGVCFDCQGWGTRDGHL